MSSLSREVQRNRLHRTIWEVANELRGAVDGWDFKSYVLGMLFYRFISENLASFIEKNEGEGFSYARLTDEQAEPIRDMMVDEKHRMRTSTKPWRRFFRASKVLRWGTRVRMT